MDGSLTAKAIAQEIWTDARRVIVDEFPDYIGIRVSRYSDDRWKGWRVPTGVTALPSETLVAAQEWIAS